jgi:hypothetical protein
MTFLNLLTGAVVESTNEFVITEWLKQPDVYVEYVPPATPPTRTVYLTMQAPITSTE